VTHDQEEALTMSDRLVVLNKGRIEQLGTPVDVYEHPASAFVAGFIGVSNLLERDGRRFTIRPEKIRLAAADEPAAPGAHSERGRIEDVIYLGSVTRYVIELDAGGTLTALRQNLDSAASQSLAERGRPVSVAWREDQTFEIEAAGAREAAERDVSREREDP
jgi:putative spermidine/putrescine transport system ATP-binding protein